MYNHFFGFIERPFKLVPNPAYLYLSQSHEEALAHLAYGLSQGDGFVIITGEVGTGKTTLCRAFLDKLDDNTEAAYIFNPKLNAVQLLAAINAEFRIHSDAKNIKDLIDTLNTYLLGQKAKGKTVIVLIDEAQNLSQDVLEQVRLLSNLETTRDKLLQIILVGQPELGDLLDSYDMRQLRQRMTLNCHLRPLTYQETKAYIHHRLHIASEQSAIQFDRAVLKAVYKYSGGIPRLINIACDRSLLSAYGKNQPNVTGRIARHAIRELSGSKSFQKGRFKTGFRTAPVFLSALLVLLILILYRPSILNHYASFNSPGNRSGKIKLPVPAVTPSPAPKASQPIPAAPQPDALPDKGLKPKPTTHDPVKKPDYTQAAAVLEPSPVPRVAKDLAPDFEGIDSRILRSQALKAAMDLWYPGAEIHSALNTMDDDATFFRLASAQNGLLSHPITCDLNLITKLNLPTILAMHPPDGAAMGYVALLTIDGRQITLQKGTTRIILDPATLATFCTGAAYVIWKNFVDIKGIVPLNSPRDSVLKLKLHLRDIGFKDIDIRPVYDAATRRAIKAVQTRHGLQADGIVGSLTKIALYNEKKALPIPHIIGMQEGKDS